MRGRRPGKTGTNIPEFQATSSQDLGSDPAKVSLNSVLPSVEVKRMFLCVLYGEIRYYYFCIKRLNIVAGALIVVHQIIKFLLIVIQSCP